MGVQHGSLQSSGSGSSERSPGGKTEQQYEAAQESRDFHGCLSPPSVTLARLDAFRRCLVLLKRNLISRPADNQTKSPDSGAE